VEHIKSTLLIIVGTFLVLFAALFLWNAINKKTEVPPEKRLEQASSASRARDFDEAARRAMQVIEQEPDLPTLWGAQTVLAQNLFFTGEKTKQIEAIRSLKDLYILIKDDPSVPSRFKAATINKLIDFYLVGRPPYVFQEIFADEPFAHLINESDNDETKMRKLAEFSNSIFKTQFATLREAVWYSGQLLNNKTISRSEQATYREKIKSLVRDADRLFISEKQYVNNSPIMSEVAYEHWRGFNLGAVAITETENRAAFENAFGTVLSFADNTTDERNAILGYLPYTYFYYASFLHEVFGDERTADIRENLQKLIALIEKNHELYKGFFLSFIQVEKGRDVESRDHNYRWFVELAGISPEFKAFLAREGWILP